MIQVGRKILIVDDDPSVRALLASALRGEYDVVEASGGRDALELSQRLHPDLVLLDVEMPGMDGYEVCRQLKAQPVDILPDVIIVSGRSAREALLCGYEAGGDDYIVKPIDIHELRSRILLHFRLRNARAKAHSLRLEIDDYGVQLRELTQRRSQELLETQAATLVALARLTESAEFESGQHVLRLRDYAQIFAEELQAQGPYRHQIDHRFLDSLYRSSPLHDIGKVGIPDSILQKPGKLTAEEKELLKQHTAIGANLLDQAVSNSPNAGFLSMASEISRFHHERWDGTGYPTGEAGKNIPLAARIVAVADVYDALTSKRPYREAHPPEAARQILIEAAGTQLDPVIVETAVRRWHDVLAVRVKYGDDQHEVTGALSFVGHELVEA
jgi:putative two-component system response regulator